MQFLIDTATDSSAELYRIGRFLCEHFATRPVEPLDAAPPAAFVTPREELEAQSEAEIKCSVVVPPPPPFVPHPCESIEQADDVEVETDSENVTHVTVSAPVSLPPAIPAPPGAAPSTELDSSGKPWDSRIHSNNKAKKIDGTWKNRRGLDPAILAAVTGAVPAVQLDTPAAVAAPVVPAVQVAPPPPSVGVPPPPAVPTVVPSPPAQGAPVISEFRALMQRILAAQAAGKTEVVHAALASVGMAPADLTPLVGDAALRAALIAALDGLGA